MDHRVRRSCGARERRPTRESETRPTKKRQGRGADPSPCTSMARELTGPPTAFEVKQYMAENGDLIEAAHERLCLGRVHESLQYQAQLQQNLIYLATHADDDPHLRPLSFSVPPAQPQQPEGDEDDEEGDYDEEEHGDHWAEQEQADWEGQERRERDDHQQQDVPRVRLRLRAPADRRQQEEEQETQEQQQREGDPSPAGASETEPNELEEMLRRRSKRTRKS